MAETTTETRRGSTKPSRKVSFRDLMEDLQRSDTSIETPEAVQHTVQISELFPSLEPKSILRKARSQHADRKKPVHHRHQMAPKSYRTEYSPRKKVKRVPGFKHPTETLSHALLRTMTHKEVPNNLTLPRLVVIPPEPNPIEEMRRAQKTKMKKIFSARTEHLPDIFTSKMAVGKLDSVCGACRRNRRTQAAAGYCKFCEEYLCPTCIHKHRMAVTRTHPVIVFYCNTCKETNILNNKGSGYCIQCKKFYCPGCVVIHCVTTGHDVLEEGDMLDVVDVLVNR